VQGSAGVLGGGTRPLAANGRPARRVEVAVTSLAPPRSDKGQDYNDNKRDVRQTTRAVRAVECVTRKLAAKNSRPSTIING
jgi:hypothetical protein